MYLKRETKKFYFKFTAALYLVLIILNIYSNIALTVSSDKFKNLEAKISVVYDEVSDLNFKLSKASSLSEIESRASKLGFVKIIDSVLVSNDKLALKNDWCEIL